MYKAIANVLLIVSCIATCGCTENVRYTLSPAPEPERPVVNVPKSMHERNWVDRNGSGSCVHASTLLVLKWQGQDELAKYWRENYAGGETARSIMNYYEQEGLRFACTTNGDPSFLDWCSDERLGCILWFKPSHCCTLLGWGLIEGEVCGAIQDNNSPGKIEWYRRDDLLREWRTRGGFAATPIITPPASPIPWQLFDIQR